MSESNHTPAFRITLAAMPLTLVGSHYQMQRATRTRRFSALTVKQLIERGLAQRLFIDGNMIVRRI